MNKHILLSKLTDQDMFILDFLCIFYLKEQRCKSRFIWKKLQDELQFYLSRRQLVKRLMALEKLELVARAYKEIDLIYSDGYLAAYWGMTKKRFEFCQSELLFKHE